MKTFYFLFSVTPSEIIRNGEFVAPDFYTGIRNEHKVISADSLNEALAIFRDYMEKKQFVTISDTAMKHPSPMYIDIKGQNEPKQVGLVFKSSMEIEFDYTWKRRWTEVWVEIKELLDVDFDTTEAA